MCRYEGKMDVIFVERNYGNSFGEDIMIAFKLFQNCLEIN